MTIRTYLTAALLVGAPVSAMAAPGVVRSSATLRAGPGAGFPAVDQIPSGARINILGCIRGGAWCDVSYAGERGWVAATALAYLHHRRYVYLPDHVDDVATVPFAVSGYWNSYYVGRPWYHRHRYWDRYWRQHGPALAQRPHAHVADRPDASVSPGTEFAGRTRHPHALGGFAHPRRGADGTIAIRHQGAPQHLGGMQPGGTAHIGARFAPGPTFRPSSTPHLAQPGVGRQGGAPMAAHAQIGPRGPLGGAAHIGAAPGFSGGRPALSGAPQIGGTGGLRGGGPGHPR